MAAAEGPLLFRALRPWPTALSPSEDVMFEILILGWLAGFVALRALVLYWAAHPPEGGLGWTRLRNGLAKRPTVVTVMFHSLVVASFSFAMLASAAASDGSRPHPTLEWLWRRGVLPFSCAYWLFDLYFYCIPHEDYLIALHHILVLVCNYPVGDLAAAELVGTLNPTCNYLMVSYTGYTFEATTFLLYVRWVLNTVLEEHHTIYFVNNALLLASWLFIRLLYSPYFLLVHMWPSCPSDELPLYSLGAAVAYLLMIAMSAVWVRRAQHSRPS